MIILTYNILNPDHAVKHQAPQGIHIDATGKIVSNWDVRKSKVIENIEASACDVACLQEVSNHTQKDFEDMFITESYAEHFTTNIKTSYGNSVISRNKNIKNNKIIESGFFKTQNQQYRIAAFTKLHDASTGLVYMILSVHLRGYDRNEKDPLMKLNIKEAGYQELKDYLSQIEAYTADVYVIAGDFNEHTSEFNLPKSRQQLLINAGYTFDKNIIPTEHGTNRTIDWVFVKSNKNLTVSKIDISYPYIDASDHFPYAVEINDA